MKRSVSILIALLATGCATPSPALKPNSDNPEVIYAIPQSQAFAIAHEAMLSAASHCGATTVHIEDISRGDGIRGYKAAYEGWFYRFFIERRLYVVPTVGVAASGQSLDGFRFEITNYYFKGWRSEYARLPGGGCEKTVISALQAALEATGTAASVTRVELSLIHI